jgi:hypothetical protein
MVGGGEPALCTSTCQSMCLLTSDRPFALQQLPEEYVCPVCGAGKERFESKATVSTGRQRAERGGGPAGREAALLGRECVVLVQTLPPRLPASPHPAQVVAGFAENQKYGLGTNSMTGEQKSLLIYGALAVFFVLFILGYSLE